MANSKIVSPQFGDALPSARPSEDTIELLLHRRSTVANSLSEPGPSRDELDLILTIGSRVPDHGKLAPWRFVVFDGDARQDFGAILAEKFQLDEPDANEARVAIERNRFMRAPTIVAVISHGHENHKIPLWEQHLSAGAVCQNMLIAASALGYAAQWLTEWYAYDHTINSALGLTSNEHVAGFVYLGTASSEPVERKRPVLSSLVSTWQKP